MRNQEKIITGNYYNKYESGNPVTRHLMGRFLQCFQMLVGSTQAKCAHEVGCGEGYLTQILLNNGIETYATDISKRLVTRLKENVGQLGVKLHTEVTSIYDLGATRHKADLVVCCEVLEHLSHPQIALQRLQGITRKNLVLSVPREPLWCILNMARLKYLKQFGNTPGHLQKWSTPKFIRMVRPYFDIKTILRPMPWTMLLCQPKNR